MIRSSVVYQSELKEGLLFLKQSADEDVLLAYLDILMQWNKAYNLTAVPSSDWVARHLLDSLAILPWIQGQMIADVGTGAGLPGIPLAIACPDRHWTLMDSNGKKIRFLQEVKRALGLSHVTLIHARAEMYQSPVLFDTIVTRAFSQIDQMMTWTRHLLAPQGSWVAMKGKKSEVLQEEGLPSSARMYDYSLPGILERQARTCVVISSTALD